MYLLIKYIKSVLWKVAKCLSYIEEARCLKVKSGGTSGQGVTSFWAKKEERIDLPLIEHEDLPFK